MGKVGVFNSGYGGVRVPIGAILLDDGSANASTTIQARDGSEFNRAANPALFNAVGLQFGYTASFNTSVNLTTNVVTKTLTSINIPSTPFDTGDAVTVAPTIGSTLKPATQNVLIDFSQNYLYDYYGNTLNYYGNPTLSNKKLVLDGAGDCLKITSIVALGAGAWSIESKFKFKANNVGYGLFDTLNRYSIGLLRLNTNKLRLSLSSNNSSYNIASNIQGTKADFDTTTEYYIRLRFTGTAYEVAWSTDGINYTTDITVNSTTSVFAPALGLIIGGYTDATTYPFAGTIDSVRVTIGSYRGDNEPFVPEYLENVLPTGLTEGTVMYARKEDTDNNTFYDTPAHATAGGETGKITPTDAGTGTFKVEYADIFRVDTLENGKIYY